jgi:hypothetical protein
MSQLDCFTFEFVYKMSSCSGDSVFISGSQWRVLRQVASLSLQVLQTVLLLVYQDSMMMVRHWLAVGAFLNMLQ